MEETTKKPIVVFDGKSYEYAIFGNARVAKRSKYPKDECQWVYYDQTGSEDGERYAWEVMFNEMEDVGWPGNVLLAVEQLRREIAVAAAARLV